jgi:hypothetical protein
MAESKLKKYLEERNIPYFMFEGKVSVNVADLTTKQMEEVFEIIDNDSANNG